MKPKPQMIKCPCGIAGARPGGVTADMIKYPNPLRLEGRKGKWGAAQRELGRKGIAGAQGNWGAKGIGAQRELGRKGSQKFRAGVPYSFELVTQRFWFFCAPDGEV